MFVVFISCFTKDERLALCTWIAILANPIVSKHDYSSIGYLWYHSIGIGGSFFASTSRILFAQGLRIRSTILFQMDRQPKVSAGRNLSVQTVGRSSAFFAFDVAMLLLFSIVQVFQGDFI